MALSVMLRSRFCCVAVSLDDAAGVTGLVNFRVLTSAHVN